MLKLRIFGKESVDYPYFNRINFAKNVNGSD